MAKATWIQTNFNGGEFSPLAYGRVDLPKYKAGLSLCQNYLSTQQGGLTRRGGTRFTALAGMQTAPPRLQHFEFSITQAYILEFGAGYINVYLNDGQLMAGSLTAYAAGTAYTVGSLVSYGGLNYYCVQPCTGQTPGAVTPSWNFTTNGWTGYWFAMPTSGVLQIPTPFSATDVWLLSFIPEADVLFIAHPTIPPTQLARSAATTWAFSTVTFLDGPYQNVNITTTTLTPAGTSGTVAVVASGVNGINNGLGFQASDVGRMLRIQCAGVWLWGTIATVTDTLHVTWAIAAPTGVYVPGTAVGTCTQSGGSIFAVSITDGGGGYGVTPPAVTFSNGATGGIAGTPTLAGGAVATIPLGVGGSGYTIAPYVTITGGGGVGAQAIATIAGGTITGFVVTRGGYGYTSPPTVTVTGGSSTGGSGAVGYANLTNGVVTSVTMAVTGTGYTNPAVSFSAPTALAPSTTTFWQLGLWCAINGYPSVVAFHQDRLLWGAATQYPNRVDGSNSGDYLNMAPTNIDGTTVDSNALGFVLNSSTVDSIQWMATDEWGLLIGTAGGEWCIAPSSTQQAITPSNVNAKQMGAYGSSTVPPIRVGKATLFIQRTGRKLREMTYQFYYSTYVAPDISLVGEHLTLSGIKQTAMQLAPYQILWMVRNDGYLVGMTYDKDQDVCGWHRHLLGGFSDAAQTLPPVVESVATIPAPGIQRDEVWLVVRRYINGQTVRTVEVMSKMWEDSDPIAFCNFLDSSAQYSGAATTTISGLTWLVGQTVKVLTDGAVHPPQVVSAAGTIGLQWSAQTVQVGLPYTSAGQTLNIEAGGQDGPSQGKLKRVFRAVFRFFQSVGLSLGSDAAGVSTATGGSGSYPQTFRSTSDPLSGPVGLFSGDQRWPYEGAFTTQGQVYWQTSDPLPSNISLLMAQIETQDAD